MNEKPLILSKKDLANALQNYLIALEKTQDLPSRLPVWEIQNELYANIDRLTEEAKRSIASPPPQQGQ